MKLNYKSVDQPLLVLTKVVLEVLSVSSSVLAITGKASLTPALLIQSAISTYLINYLHLNHC